MCSELNFQWKIYFFQEHSPFHVVDEAKRVAESLVAQLTKAAQTDLVSSVGTFWKFADKVSEKSIIQGVY